MNKKALDQYTNFTEQREELARRQTEHGRGEDKIKQLIQTLDLRKDEAIERTFKASLFAWPICIPSISLEILIMQHIQTPLVSEDL